MSELNNLSNAVIGRPNSDITICFDLDGVLAENNNGDYENAKPIELGIKNINVAYDEGYRIVIFTARFGKRYPDRQYQLGYELTLNWLRKHNIKFHELRMGKPHYDLQICDKSVRVQGNNDVDWIKAWDLISELGNKNQYGQYLNG